MKKFSKPNVFPYEAFVQESIEKHFVQQGYVIEKDHQVDIIASRGDDKWIIEAKGITEAVGTDFNTCIGQLAKSMTTDQNNYALAIPRHIKYKRQCELLSQFFRELVQLHILVVDSEGQIDVIKPSESIDEKTF